MRPTHILAGLALSMLAFACHAATELPPRSDVESVARTIEENYFDESRAKQIANDLRAAATKGEFDTLIDNRELASALSIRLKSYDRHFKVAWSATADEQPATAADAPVKPPTSQSLTRHRRGNYGVRSAEVLPGNLGYLDLRGFAPFEFGVAGQPERQAIEAALQVLAHTDALIIDLRENGGGAPQMVGYLSSVFVQKGADIFNTFHGRDRTMSEAPLDWYPQPRLETPLFLLTSARTASAAEAFSYTLQSAKRAVVVGETTMGAANPGGEVDAGNGFSIFISFATPINPLTGANWEARGVAPDVVVAPNIALDAARRLALEAVLANGLPADAATDTRWVLEALRAETGATQPVRTRDFVGSFGTMVVTASEDRLNLRQDRRPLRSLLPLGADTFTTRENPSQRIVFERDGYGRVIALEMRHSDGDLSRHRRDH